MTYTLEQLSSDIKAALKADPGPGGKEAVCKLVSKVCLEWERMTGTGPADSWPISS